MYCGFNKLVCGRKLVNFDCGILFRTANKVIGKCAEYSCEFRFSDIGLLSFYIAEVVASSQF